MTGRIHRARLWVHEVWERHKFRITLTTLGLLFLTVFFWNHIFISIYPGHAGVLWSRLLGGTNLQRWYGEGLQVILPINRMHIYDVRVQSIEGTIKVLSSNGLLIDLDWTVRFHPKRETLPFLHREVGPEYIESFIRPEAIHALRTIVGNYTPDQIYSRDEDGLLQEIQALLARSIQEYITLDSMLLRRLMLPDLIQNAIQSKLEQEQIALSYPYRLLRETQERDRKVVEADGIQQFEQISGISILRWRGIEATVQLATSENAKIIVIGTSADGLPIILNTQQ